MSEHVYWLLETEVKEGQLAALKELMAEMVAATQADEPGALFYEWYFNKDESRLTIYEHYADSAAVLVHLDNFGKKFGARFMGALDIKKFTVYGHPDETAVAALKNVGARTMKLSAGFAR